MRMKSFGIFIVLICAFLDCCIRRVCHWDGDTEDLELKELKSAMSRQKMKSAFTPEKRQKGRKRVQALHGHRRCLVPLIGRAGKEKEDVKGNINKKEKTEAGSESEFVASGGSSDSSDEDFEESSSKSKSKVSSDDDDDDDVKEEAPIPTRYVFVLYNMNVVDSVY